MTDAEEVAAKITQLPGLDFNVVASHIASGANGEENEIVAIFNPRRSETTVTLPEGKWKVYVNAENAGTKILAEAEGEITVEPISAMVLVKGDWMSPEQMQQAMDANGGMLPVVLGALTASVIAYFLIRRKRR